MFNEHKGFPLLLVVTQAHSPTCRYIYMALRRIFSERYKHYDKKLCQKSQLFRQFMVCLSEKHIYGVTCTLLSLVCSLEVVEVTHRRPIFFWQICALERLQHCCCCYMLYILQCTAVCSNTFNGMFFWWWLSYLLMHIPWWC